MALHLPTTVADILNELDGFIRRPGATSGAYALSHLMEFDCPITVHADGTVTDGPADVYAPNLMDGELDDDSWTLMDGYSGQYGYSGPVMHDSEYIGGHMARDILNAPGTYVAIAAYWMPEDEDDDDAETTIEGWAVARLKD